LPDEVRDNAFKALRATSRAFGLPLRDREPKQYGEGEFASDDLAEALRYHRLSGSGSLRA